MSRRSSKVDRRWLHDHLTDPYVKLATREGYRARAAYKLKEIDEQLGLVRDGQRIVDLGSAPGAWSQYLQRRLGLGRPDARGTVVALDLLPMEPVEGVTFVQGDFRDEAVEARLAGVVGPEPLDLVVSDMAPNLSGVAASDAARMADLVELALAFSAAHLRPEGALVAKVFHGSGYSQLVEAFKGTFRTVQPIKPKASRDRSAETFLVGRRLR